MVTNTGRGTSTGTDTDEKDASFSAAFFNLSAQDGLTAFAGGGQANAVPVSGYQVTRFSTVANGGDSVLLGLANLGFWRVVINGGVQPMNVYPRVGDQINMAGVNVPFSIPAGKTCMFFCAPGGPPTGGGNWNALLSA